MDYNEDLNPLKLLLDSGSNGDEFSRKIADFFPAIMRRLQTHPWNRFQMLNFDWANLV